VELEHCLAHFRQSLDRPRGRSLTIADVDRDLSAACGRLSKVIRELRADLLVFRDPEQLRRSLKDLELKPEPDELDDLEAFADIFQVATPPRRPKRRRRR
jgi:hypothetical protein